MEGNKKLRVITKGTIENSGENKLIFRYIMHPFKIYRNRMNVKLEKLNSFRSIHNCESTLKPKFDTTQDSLRGLRR